MTNKVVINLKDNSTTVGNLTAQEESALDAKKMDFLAEKEANKYKEDRRSAYKPIEEQLDMMYWDKVNGSNNWSKHIESVKTAHPKPEGA